MNELLLFNKLKEAYETSTRNFNSFKEAISSVNWDNKFEADGEIYFMLGKFTLAVENLDPFKEQWKPTVYFTDGYVKEF